MKTTKWTMTFAAALALAACTSESPKAPLGYKNQELGPANLVRCGTAPLSDTRVREVEREIDGRLGVRNASRRPRRGGGTVVDVFFHVITGQNGEGDVSQGQIVRQLAVLNTGYEGSGFQFAATWVERVANDTWHNSCGVSSVEDAMKFALYHASPPEAQSPGVMHVYLCNADPYLGWAYFPSSVVGTKYYYYDGVVLDYRSLPGGSYVFESATEPDGVLNYAGGNTLTHEAGHWFELYHTFGDGCGPGDHVDDTPTQSSPQFYCIERDSCWQPKFPGIDPHDNFMNYTDDDCLNHFSSGQADRMSAFWTAYRQ